MRVSYKPVIAVLVGLFCLQCSTSTEPNEPDPAPPPHRTPADLTAAEKSLLNSSNRFGLKLFREVAASEEPDLNLFISPLSVSFALGMTLNGAVGETRDSMAATLELAGLTRQEINESYRGLTTLLTQLDPNVVFKIANSIWYRLGKKVTPTFIDLSRTYFNALVREMDFQADGAADTINHWVDVNTNGRITEIVKPPIHPDVAMMLINAIYFKGAWTVPFDTGETFTGWFQLADGSRTDCRMMTINSEADTTFSFSYFENELFQAVDLPYGDEAFSMTVFLPKPSVTADELIQEFTEENWAAWMGSFSETEMQLCLPRFKFEYKIKLNEVLKAMGMALAFTPDADFSDMFADGVGWIDEVRHKTFVQVDEEGTEAAAVTIVIMVDSCPPGMYVDRPFLFVIHEHESGTILFMGRVADPVWND